MTFEQVVSAVRSGKWSAEFIVRGHMLRDLTRYLKLDAKLPAKTRKVMIIRKIKELV